jgi:hypothetical protein
MCLLLNAVRFGNQRAFQLPMTAAAHSGRKAAGLIAVLLTLVVLNAGGICAAAAELTARPAHPCCPAPSRTAPMHCAKLGCFMSDPVIRPEAQPNGGAAATIQFDAFLIATPAREPVPLTTAAGMPHQRFLTFHQLLI